MQQLPTTPPRLASTGLIARQMQGAILIESLMAMLIIGLGIVGLVGLQGSVMRGVVSANYRTQAALAAQYIIEAVRANPASTNVFFQSSTAPGNKPSPYCHTPPGGGKLVDYFITTERNYHNCRTPPAKYGQFQFEIIDTNAAGAATPYLTEDKGVFFRPYQATTISTRSCSWRIGACGTEYRFCRKGSGNNCTASFSAWSHHAKCRWCGSDWHDMPSPNFNTVRGGRHYNSALEVKYNPDNDYNKWTSRYMVPWETRDVGSVEYNVYSWDHGEKRMENLPGTSHKRQYRLRYTTERSGANGEQKLNQKTCQAGGPSTYKKTYLATTDGFPKYTATFNNDATTDTIRTYTAPPRRSGKLRLEVATDSNGFGNLVNDSCGGGFSNRGVIIPGYYGAKVNQQRVCDYYTEYNGGVAGETQTCSVGNSVPSLSDTDCDGAACINEPCGQGKKYYVADRGKRYQFNSPACTPQQAAAVELYDWRQRLASSGPDGYGVPGGEGLVCITSENLINEGTPSAPQCSGSGIPVVKIWYRDSRAASAGETRSTDKKLLSIPFRL